MESFIKKNPKVFIVFYFLYVIILNFLLGKEYSFLTVALVTPLTIFIGIYVWEWQESVKNERTKKELYKKNYNEKAEKIFGIYTRYEKHVQTLYHFFSDMNNVLQAKVSRRVSKSKEISLLIEKMDVEIKFLQELEFDLYNEAVLFYYLVSKEQSDINVYQDATNLKNNLHQFIYVSKKIAELVETYRYSEKSDPDREVDLIKNYYTLKPIINSFNFGYSQDPKEIIYLRPRTEFLELTKSL